MCYKHNKVKATCLKVFCFKYENGASKTPCFDVMFLLFKLIATKLVMFVLQIFILFVSQCQSKNCTAGQCPRAQI